VYQGKIVTTYNDHPNTMVIDFYGHREAYKSRLVVEVHVREALGEIDISYPLGLFSYYNEITRTVLRTLGCRGNVGSIGCSRRDEDEDPENWRTHRNRTNGCNHNGNGRCHVKGLLFGRVRGFSSLKS
jgi:hypothetical protein